MNLKGSFEADVKMYFVPLYFSNLINKKTL